MPVLNPGPLVEMLAIDTCTTLSNGVVASSSVPLGSSLPSSSEPVVDVEVFRSESSVGLAVSHSGMFRVPVVGRHGGAGQGGPVRGLAELI